MTTENIKIKWIQNKNKNIIVYLKKSENSIICSNKLYIFLISYHLAILRWSALVDICAN